MKEYLSQKGIAFTERNAIADPEAMAELEKIGILSTPVTVIDSELIVGLDRRKLDALVAS